MSEKSSDDGWQIATGRGRKSDPKPAAEAESSAHQSPASAIEHTATSLNDAMLYSAVLHSTSGTCQQTSLPVTVASAEQSQASHLTIPKRSSPEKSSVSSSLDKGYLTAQQSPSSDVRGTSGSGSEEVYLSAEEFIGEPTSIISDPSPLLRSPDFHTQFLSFPSPGLQSQSEGEDDISGKVSRNSSQNIADDAPMRSGLWGCHVFANSQSQEKTQTEEAAARTLDTGSIFVPDRPQAIGSGSGLGGDTDTELWTKQAMLNVPISSKRSTYSFIKLRVSTNLIVAKINNSLLPSILHLLHLHPLHLL